MIPVERHRRILALMKQYGVVNINELAETPDMPHTTVHRNVSKLEKQGLLTSVSSGVRIVSRLTTEPSHLVKNTLRSGEKQVIDTLATSHIAKNSCICLDTRTTTLALTRVIFGRGDLQVVTNDFEIAQLLTDASRCDMIHTGDTLCQKNHSCADELAMRTLRRLVIDTAFIFANDRDNHDIFAPDENKVTIKETVSQISTRNVPLCDNSKYNQMATLMTLPLARSTTIIVDRHLSDAVASHIARYACEVLRAD